MSLNNAGAAAFLGGLDAGGFGLFAGTNPATDQVVLAGQSLFGSQVGGFGFSRNGLNDLGQLAFTAFLADGRQVVVRADPTNVIPEPGTLPLLAALAVLGINIVRRRRAV